jgi:hypothetical protein
MCHQPLFNVETSSEVIEKENNFFFKLELGFVICHQPILGVETTQMHL